MDKNPASVKDYLECAPGGNNLPSENTCQVPVRKKIKTEPEYGECSTSSQVVNQEDYVSTSESKTERKEMDMDRKILMNAAKWPHFVLRLIFRFLCICDLVNVQKVCKSWEEATKHSSVWRHTVVFTKKNTRCVNLDMLSTVPYVQTITGQIFDESELDAIKNNVYNLKKMDFTIYIKNFSSAMFQEFITRFQSLEFIRINNSAFFMESLELLSSFPKLKAFQLRYNPESENFSHFCRLIADGFPALRDLSIYREYGKKDGKDALSELLRKKISQLTDLKLSYDDVHPSIFEQIFESMKMKTISIRMSNCSRISFNLSKMINLKSLNFQVACDCDYTQRLELLKNSVETFQTLIFPNSLQHLNLDFDSEIKSPPGIVNTIINFLLNLRVLSICGICDPDIDQQLEKISDLQHLHTVSFKWCTSLSAPGVENILRCSQLRSLNIHMGDYYSFDTYISLEDTTYDRLKECKFLGNLELHNCILDLEKLLPTILAMRYLTNLNIRDCKGKRATGELIGLYMGVITDIIETCKNEKHSVKIECWAV